MQCTSSPLSKPFFLFWLLQGEFTPRRNPHATALLARQTLPDFAEVDKMVYIWLTDHVFNTASLVYHEGEELRMTISPRDVS